MGASDMRSMYATWEAPECTHSHVVSTLPGEGLDGYAPPSELDRRRPGARQ